MKILKRVLVLILLALILMLFGVIFSNNILSVITKTKNSEFKNIKFSMKNSEMTFNNFIVNGEDLGKGKAIVKLTKGGFLKIMPTVKLSNVRLEEVDLDKIYQEKNTQIDNFIEKLEVPTQTQTQTKSSDKFVQETTLNTQILANNIDDFINNKIKDDIIKINNLKNDYQTSQDLKNKAQKVLNLNEKLDSLVKIINAEKENAEKQVSKIEDEKNLMLENVSKELEKLEKEVSLNDVNKMNNNNIQNMNLYIFMDKGKIIGKALNKSLKTINLVEEIKNLKIPINDLNINNGEIIINNLKNKDNLTGTISLDNSKILINEKNQDYQMIFNQNDLSIKTLYSNKKINTVIEYLKNNLIDGKIVKLVSEVILQNNNFKNLNNTVLSDEEKQLLLQKVENIKTNDYNNLMQKYTEQTNIVENLIQNVNEKILKLDTLKKDLLTLDKIVVLENPQVSNDNKNNQTEQNIQNSKNQ